MFDNVFIPWENVLHSPRHRADQEILSAIGLFQRLHHPGLHAARGEARFHRRPPAKAPRATGVEAFRGIQAQIGEVIGWRNLFWSLTDAMACNPVPWVNGAVLPNARGSPATGCSCPRPIRRCATSSRRSSPRR